MADWQRPEWEIHNHFHRGDDLSEVKSQLRAMDTKLTALVTQGVKNMGQLDDLKQNMQDLEDLGQKYLDFIVSKDQIIADKDAKIKELADQLAADQITIEQFQAGMAEAITSSQATEDKMRAGLPGVPPVGGTALNLSYADRAAFDAAAAAYTGPEQVTVDGTEVKAGTTPALAYFVQADGSVSTTPVNVGGVPNA